jgi:hypothetical protein
VLPETGSHVPEHARREVSCEIRCLHKDLGKEPYVASEHAVNAIAGLVHGGVFTV